MARTLLFQSKLPISFWGECILTSTYLINRIPTTVLGHVSPYEKLFKSPPSYSHMRIFGCLAYASQHPSDKFDSRAIPTIFVGYPANHKGYKLYDFSSHTFLVSRHVVFHEDVFPSDKLTLQHLPYHPYTPEFTDDEFLSPLDSFIVNEHDTPDINTQSPSNSQDISSHDTDSLDDIESVLEPHPFTTLPEEQVSHSPSVPVRSSTRHKIQPSWMKDYHLSNFASPQFPYSPTISIPVAVSSVVLLDCPVDDSKFNISNYSISPSIYSCAVSSTTHYKEPSTYNQAVTDQRWIDAMHKELQALESNQTWSILPLPDDKKVVGCKWVYRVKYNSDGTLDKFKARLVVKGYTQT